LLQKGNLQQYRKSSKVSQSIRPDAAYKEKSKRLPKNLEAKVALYDTHSRPNYAKNKNEKDFKENMNRNPEQIARDTIDKKLISCGWIIQNFKQVNLHAGLGVAVREYLTDIGPADYVLFVDGKPCGVIDKEDFDLNPFNAQGGLGKMWQLFGDTTEEIIGELNEALAA